MALCLDAARPILGHGHLIDAYHRHRMWLPQRCPFLWTLRPRCRPFPWPRRPRCRCPCVPPHEQRCGRGGGEGRICRRKDKRREEWWREMGEEEEGEKIG